jgi:hypothetical protein
MYKSLKQAIRNGDWDTIGQLLELAITDKVRGSDAEGQVAENSGKTQPGRPDRGVGMATGGYVSGPGSPTSDSIPARLSNGEYVVNASTVKKHGKKFFDKLNGGHNVGVPGPGGYGLAKGGFIGEGMMGGALKGMTLAIQNAFDKIAGSVSTGGSETVDEFGGVEGLASGDIVMWDGEPVDQLVAKQLRFAGKLLGSRYSVYQGSYQPETSYSGTTHTDGGVIDTNGSGVFGPEVVSLQKAGFAAWYRGPGAPGVAGSYPAHIHAISLFSKNLDTNAAYQRGHYINMTGDGVGGEYYGPHVAPMKIPGLRGGGRINYDNTIANLHRGETVLTAPLTKAFAENVAGSTSNVYNLDVDVHNPTSNVDVEKAVLDAMRKHEIRMGRNRRIGNR